MSAPYAPLSTARRQQQQQRQTIIDSIEEAPSWVVRAASDESACVGHGTLGRVYLCLRDGTWFAVKRMDGRMAAILHKEYTIMRTAAGEFVPSVHGEYVHRDPATGAVDSAYLIMEALRPRWAVGATTTEGMDGKEDGFETLEDSIFLKRGVIATEQTREDDDGADQHVCATAMLKLIIGLRSVHRLHIAHNDIKPDNIMIRVKRTREPRRADGVTDVELVLVDWGHACDIVSVAQWVVRPTVLFASAERAHDHLCELLVEYQTRVLGEKPSPMPTVTSDTSDTSATDVASVQLVKMMRGDRWAAVVVMMEMLTGCPSIARLQAYVRRDLERFAKDTSEHAVRYRMSAEFKAIDELNTRDDDGRSVPCHVTLETVRYLRALDWPTGEMLRCATSHEEGDASARPLVFKIFNICTVMLFVTTFSAEDAASVGAPPCSARHMCDCFEGVKEWRERDWAAMRHIADALARFRSVGGPLTEKMTDDEVLDIVDTYVRDGVVARR